MEYVVIASGSTGNALVLNDVVMVDCGVAWKKLLPFYRKLQLVLLTHIHSDHFNKTTIRRLAKERPTLRFGCGSWLVADLVGCGVKKSNIDVCISGISLWYVGYHVVSFDLEHDVPNCGYKISFDNLLHVETGVYATDTVSLPDLPNCDYYFIEANYKDTEELEERMRAKELTGEYCHEKRVLDYHLSEKYATDYLVRNSKPSSQFVFLHEHKNREG